MERKNIRKRLLYIFFSLLMFVYTADVSMSAPTATAPAPASKTAKQAVSLEKTAICVSPLQIVENPSKYLNKEVEFTADFVTFSPLGLDYKPAFRDSAKYIAILIKRPDITDHTVPLSEMKIFIKREIAEKNIDVESGDKIKITGTVFSTALGDPWMEAKTFTMLNPKSKDKVKTDAKK